MVKGDLSGARARPHVQLNAHIEQGIVVEWMAAVPELVRIGISAQKQRPDPTKRTASLTSRAVKPRSFRAGI
jgi:hypothetical protein